MLVAHRKRVMGKHTNGRWINLLGSGGTGAMVAAATGLVLTWSHACFGPSPRAGQMIGVHDNAAVGVAHCT